MKINPIRRLRRDERGFSLLLTAMVLPVLVIFAALGMGGAIVRTTADETQRSAELSALAAAVALPNLGRPDVTGKPAVPSAFYDALPPEISKPPTSPCNAAGVVYDPAGPYSQIDATNDCVDESISRTLGQGPIGSYHNLFGPWHAGCDVAEAQYATGRAKLSRNFALESAGTPKTPTCPSSTTGLYANGHPERVYIRAEMESMGAFQLQQCLVQGAGCFNAPTQTANGELQAMGSAFNTVMANVPGRLPAPSNCVISPTTAGCPLSQSELSKTLSNAGVPNADSVATAVSSAFPSQISDLAGPAYEKAATGIDSQNGNYAAITQQAAALATIVASTFATTSGGMCGIALGSSGQTLCGSGIDLASLLPSTLSPRVRAIIAHAINVPLAPRFNNFLGEGDLAFVEQGLARRTFKNAIVVPTIPGQLVAPTATGANTCYTGGIAANTVAGGGASWTLNTLAAQLGGTAGAGNGVNLDTCGNAQIDNTTVDPTNCNNSALSLTQAQRDAACTVAAQFSAVIDTVNNAPLTTQKALVSAAGGMNEQANRAVNTVVAQQMNAEDPGHSYDAADCSNTNATTHNPQTPASWCVDVGGQQIRDMQDFYNSPPDGTGPTYNDVLASAASSGEPLAVEALSKSVDMCAPNVAGPSSGNICAAINSALSASLGRALTPAETVKSLPMIIPVLDVVPVIVHADNTKPGGYRFEVVPNATSTPGFYRAVLLDPNEAFPLCANGGAQPPRVQSCISQPTVLAANPLPTTITLPVTTPTTAATTSTTALPTTLPPTTTPPTTTPPTTTPPTTLPPTTLPHFP